MPAPYGQAQPHTWGPRDKQLWYLLARQSSQMSELLVQWESLAQKIRQEVIRKDARCRLDL